MFLGHFAVGLAAKKVAPKTSLATLLASAEFVDMLWPVFLLSGTEHVRIAPGATAVTPLDLYDYPLSHSLLTGAAWAAGLALAYFALRRYRRGAWVVGACVLSHWVLDAVSHRPDMPLYPGGRTYVGLGLWNSVAATVAVEFGLFVAGVALYARSTAARDRMGQFAFWSLASVLAVLYVASLVGPPPPDVRTLALVSMAGWLLIPWAWWADSHREPTGS
ncbi:MAG: hypothetical protein LAN62_06170 [Acidobacteriia bacterium]|nr:hypothetical protein [Terriglobia bacterium]